MATITDARKIERMPLSHTDNGAIYSAYAFAYPPTPYSETAEEKAARAAHQLERERAEKRAEQLLLDCLTPEQERQYSEHGYFETEVDDRTYRIKKGRSNNVEMYAKGKLKYRYCAHPGELMPDQDVMLAQLLMLKTSEATFLETANRTVLA